MSCSGPDWDLCEGYLPPEVTWVAFGLGLFVGYWIGLWVANFFFSRGSRK